MLDNQPELGEISNPSIAFSIDPHKDAEKIIAFLSRPDPIREGINFPEVINSRLPGLREQTNNSGIEVGTRAYVDQYYQEHKAKIDKQLAMIQADWGTVAPQYFSAMNQIFGDSPWPYHSFRGVYTITYPCPRFLETGEFQVFPSHRGHHTTTVGHELHHFRFFEFLRRNYCPEVESLDERQIIGTLRSRFTIPVWELSEALVKAHFDDPPFTSLLPRTEDYPGLADTFSQVKDLWQKSNRNLSAFMQLIEKK